jgi:hypothetical protein
MIFNDLEMWKFGFFNFSELPYSLLVEGCFFLIIISVFLYLIFSMKKNLNKICLLYFGLMLFVIQFSIRKPYYYLSIILLCYFLFGNFFGETLKKSAGNTKNKIFIAFFVTFLFISLFLSYPKINEKSYQISRSPVFYAQIFNAIDNSNITPKAVADTFPVMSKYYFRNSNITILDINKKEIELNYNNDTFIIFYHFYVGQELSVNETNERFSTLEQKCRVTYEVAAEKSSGGVGPIITLFLC